MDYGLDYESGGGGGGMGGGGRGASTPSNSRTGGGGGNTQSSGGGGGRKRASFDEQTMTAVTVSMMMASQPQQMHDSNGLQLQDGRNLYHVLFVGAVRSFDDHSTHVMYQMEDGTGGVIGVKQWLDDSAECSATAEIRRMCAKEHVYLKVVGQLKDYDGSKVVLADSIRPLSTANELTHHFLRVVYQAELHKKGGHAGAAAGSSAMGGMGGGYGGTPVLNRGAPLQHGGGSGGNNDALRQAVLSAFATHGERGNSIDGVVDNLRGRYSEDAIRGEVNFLTAEGKLYSTIDDDHYAVA